MPDFSELVALVNSAPSYISFIGWPNQHRYFLAQRLLGETYDLLTRIKTGHTYRIDRTLISTFVSLKLSGLSNHEIVETVVSRKMSVMYYNGEMERCANSEK